VGRTPGSRRYDYGGPSRYIAEHGRPGDGILFLGKFYRKAEPGYPGDFRNTSDFAMAVSPARAGDFQGQDKPFAVTYPLMLAHRRIWVFGTNPLMRRPPGLIGDESVTLERRFTLIDRHRFHGVLVTLWLRR
jgi:mannosyltransferase